MHDKYRPCLIFLNRDPNNQYFLTCTFINNLKEGSLLWRYKENHKNHVNVTKKLSKIPLDFEKSFSTTEEGLIKRKNNEDNLEYITNVIEGIIRNSIIAIGKSNEIEIRESDKIKESDEIEESNEIKESESSSIFDF
ncbi:hypothetical protein Glove_10g19 [Diversispora epigaea]|uniref:Uncharacterized protein n=1 Tax=Diversispora epigaea TaxID=1348612 RepID=A0A397JWX2_9GLOM|nr:hypothetical protein Glove_10g19 [Diversispora epigaea]